MNQSRCAISFLCILVASCAGKKDFGHLTNGYSVFAASPLELYVAKADGAFVVGPGVTEIGVTGSKLIVKCNSLKNEISNTCGGIFIIETSDNSIARAEDEVSLSKMLDAINVDRPPFKPAASYFTGPLP